MGGQLHHPGVTDGLDDVYGRSSAGGSIHWVQTETRHVVLTYDDGPQPGGTDSVLEALAEYQASATFFVLISRVERYRHLLEEVIAAGHEIGLHGVDHRRLPDFPAHEVAARTGEARDRLQEIIGQPVTWFRPPYGAQSLETWHAVVSTGLTPVLWSHSLRDWQTVPDETRHDIAVDSARPGSIMLAHDGFAGPQDGAYDGTPPDIDRGALARSLLEVYRAADLQGSSLTQALRTGSAGMKVRLTS